MSKVKIVLNKSGLRELMCSDEIIDIMSQKADETIRKCPKGYYEKSIYIGKNRANVSIFTDDEETYWRNVRKGPNENEVIKALR